MTYSVTGGASLPHRRNGLQREEIESNIQDKRYYTRHKSNQASSCEVINHVILREQRTSEGHLMSTDGQTVHRGPNRLALSYVKSLASHKREPESDQVEELDVLDILRV